MTDTHYAEFIVTALVFAGVTYKTPNWPLHVLLNFLEALIWLGQWARHAREGAMTGYNIYRLRRQGFNGISMSVSEPVLKLHLDRTADVMAQAGKAS